MHCIGIAKKIMQVAENFLVSANQESAQNVGVIVEGMQQQRLFDVAAIDELIDLAVRITGNIADNAAARRHLVQPMNGHYREELFDGPTVRYALEQREIAEVSIGQHPIQNLEFFGEVFEFLRHTMDAPANRPVKFLGLAALGQGQITKAEQVEGGIERLLRVVKTLQQILRAERAESLL